MKKKLEADLISIAHRILKLKNKSDINQLYLETQKLYEKLAVLKFVDENYDTLKPTIGLSEIHAEVESIFDNKQTITPVPTTEEETPLTQEEILVEISREPAILEQAIEEIVAETPEETIAEPIAEIPEEILIEESVEAVLETEKETPVEILSFTTTNDLNPIPGFIPAFELEEEETEEVEEPHLKIVEEPKEEPKIETSKRPTPVQISFEDIMGAHYADAQFVKVDSFEAVAPAPPISDFQEQKAAVETAVVEPVVETKTATLNEKLAKGFHIDLNDRIAFTKNLFGNSSEDYSRVLNQLVTFDNYSEALEFIENMVKPDYNNWEGKDDYAERFLGIVEKKFS
jgi:hypothetical protein